MTLIGVIGESVSKMVDRKIESTKNVSDTVHDILETLAETEFGQNVGRAKEDLHDDEMLFKENVLKVTLNLIFMFLVYIFRSAAGSRCRCRGEIIIDLCFQLINPGQN